MSTTSVELLEYHNLIQEDDALYAAACFAMFAEQVWLAVPFMKSLRPVMENLALVNECKFSLSRPRTRRSNCLRE
jgi:hypothetical protein